MDAERERGIAEGRAYAEHISAHELASLVSGSFDDIARLMPPDASDHFVGGFREGLLHVWRGA